MTLFAVAWLGACDGSSEPIPVATLHLDDAADAATEDGSADTSADDSSEPDAGAGDVQVEEDTAPPLPTNSCCELSDAPGCVNAAISECVCAELPFCCQDAWTGKCVEAGNVLCNAGCGGTASETGSSCGDEVCSDKETCESCPVDCGYCAGTGGCCDAHESVGCEALETTTCVCAVDDYCCLTAWDDLCVHEAGSDCGAGCVVPSECGDGTCDPDETCEACAADCGVCDPGDCCTPGDAPGCESSGLEACVCQADPFCCTTAWDSLCVLGAKDTCGAACSAPTPTCGDGLCDGTEGCASCPGDCGGCGTSDCCVESSKPGCGDAAVQACVCKDDDFCCQSEWDDKCAAAAPSCGASCGDGCACGWATGACGDATAVLEIVALDVWAQALPSPEIDVTNGDQPVAPDGDAPWQISLCGKASLGVAIQAPLHDPLLGTLAYDGQGQGASLSFKSAAGAPKAAWALTTDVRTVQGQQTRFYTLHTGLAHRWFAPAGRPARPGTRVTLLRDGEEAWETLQADLSLAKSLVTASSWWWTSELELVRDPATHMYLSPQERWKNTILGRLEAEPQAERRVLVNQFYSQDGLLSSITVDDELVAKAKAEADDFEFMGMASDVHGKFVVTPKVADFAGRLKASGAGATFVASAPYPAVSGPISVDTTALPLGLGWFELSIASWHQKFMSIDAEVAFVGGMNFKTTDWDDSNHAVFNERRMQFAATTEAREKVKAKKKLPDLGPRKDYIVRVEGPAAVDVEDVFRERWEAQLAAGVEYADQSTPFSPGTPAPPLLDGAQAQIVATMPAPFSENSIMEALLRAVSRAEQYIFIEDQYFRAPLLIDKVIQRMNEVPALILIVVTNPVSEWKEPGCWQTYIVNEKLAKAFPSRYRTYRLQSFDAVDTGCTFCIDEFDATFQSHDLHSKLVIIDDVWVEAGSCNSNNRGLLYEGELAVVVYDAATAIAARDAIFANMLGSGYVPGTAPSDLIGVFDARAKKNQEVWKAWDAVGMDLDLDGDPLPAKYKPTGFLYPLTMGKPSDCFIENVGPDVM